MTRDLDRESRNGLFRTVRCTREPKYVAVKHRVPRFHRHRPLSKLFVNAISVWKGVFRAAPVGFLGQALSLDLARSFSDPLSRAEFGRKTREDGLTRLSLSLYRTTNTRDETKRSDSFAFLPRGIAKAGEPNNFLPMSPASLHMDPTVYATLRRKQRRLARENPGVLMAVARGANQAIAECQHQFRNRRWNCSTKNFLRGKNLFGKIVDRGKHISFLFAATFSLSTNHRFR